MRFFWLLLTVAFVGFPRISEAFTMSPTMLDVLVQPGASASAYVTIGNDEREPATYYLSVQKFVPNGDQGQQEFLPPTEKSGLPSWVQLDRVSVTLRPGEIRRVPFEVKVPAGTQPGGYYGVLFFSNVPPGSNADQSIVAGSRAGMLLFVTVKGAIIEESELQTFEVDHMWTNRLPVLFTSVLQNKGNAFLIPQGSVTVKNLFGQTVAQLPFNPEYKRVLPNSGRRYTQAWAKRTPENGGGFWYELSEEWKNFAFGRYRAELRIVGQSAGTMHRAETVIYVFPWRLMLVAGFLTVLISVPLVRARRDARARSS